MKKFISSLLLLTIAVIVFIPFTIWGIIEHIVQTFYKKRFFKALGVFGEILLLFATVIDVFLNVIFQVPLNRLLVKNRKGENSQFEYEITPYAFGNRKDTISRALGMNEKQATLTKTGDFICRFLNLIEKNHCKKSI